MGGDGVSDISAGAGEGVGGVVNEDPFEMVKSRIVGGDERQMVSVSRWTGGVWVMETTG